eukprot:5671713-Pleurochrysis_carterae.AAC.2
MGVFTCCSSLMRDLLVLRSLQPVHVKLRPEDEVCEISSAFADEDLQVSDVRFLMSFCIAYEASSATHASIGAHA